ncbi:MAG: serine protease [Segetibacter sp.]|jgi:serine protease Do|nr:serine protease [Segetibacter sp.]
MTVKQSVAVVLLSAATSVGSMWGYGKYQQSQPAGDRLPTISSLFKNAAYTGESAVSGPMVDFEKAATKAAPAVVHIRTVTKAKQVAVDPRMQDNPFKDFFGDGLGDMFEQRGNPAQPRAQRGSGSGVSISEDGYIVTNNHVIDGADELLVTLNNKKDYKAKLIGKDPSSDLAVIKIEADNLPYLSFANSDDVHLGQWVLAIGYPLNLETTVTSGIVSAKSRSIGINSRQSKSAVEAFIQTDAAVNPGNSGGALVNTDGNVIGINSAIASPTGSYAGYAYAIPSNMVQRVVNDLIKYGATKRAYLGVMFGNDQMTEEDRKKNNVKEGEGVFVMDVAKGSAADEAGVQKGDFITKVNGIVVNTGTEMVEKIAAMRPGDKISLTYQHNGIEKTASATLKGSSGTYESVKEQVVEQLGATFESLEKSKAAQLGLQPGVVVKSLGQGILTEQTRIKEGFIITKVNNARVSTVDELKEALKNAGNSAIITGVYPGQPQTEYQYALNDLQ